MAVMYSMLGGCQGETTNLGPLARRDLCAGVKGLLDKLMTHLGLGSSIEEPWGVLLTLLLLGEEVLPPWELALPARGVVLFSWEAWEDWGALCLGECLTAWLPWETSLFHWRISLSTWKALSLVECLTAWLETKLLPAWEETKLLLDWGLLPSLEVPSLESVLLLGEALAPWEAVLSWKGGYLPAWGGTKLLIDWELHPSWERPSLEGLLLGGMMLASWEAVLSQGRLVPACLWRANCYPSGLGSLQSYISFLFAY